MMEVLVFSWEDKSVHSESRYVQEDKEHTLYAQEVIISRFPGHSSQPISSLLEDETTISDRKKIAAFQFANEGAE